jgi:hypothetical protein
MNDYKVEIKLEDGVLNARVSGQFPYERLEKPENAFERFIDACSAYQCNKILVDSRELRAKFSTSQLFRAGKDAVSLTTAGIWVAIATRKDLRDTFFDDVVANRGGQIGVFTEMNAARDWLDKFPTGLPNAIPQLSIAEPAVSR